MGLFFLSSTREIGIGVYCIPFIWRTSGAPLEIVICTSRVGEKFGWSYELVTAVSGVPREGPMKESK
jgi:hypothetical protein